MRLRELVESCAAQLIEAKVSFGHGTDNAMDEAAWLVLWCLGLPLDTPLDGGNEVPDETYDSPEPADPNSIALGRTVTPKEQAKVSNLINQRIALRKPAAYLTNEAWLQGVSFYVDERSIVPRSLIAETLVQGDLDYWLNESAQKILDLCTGNGSLSVIAAMVYPESHVIGSDISAAALEVASINVLRHDLSDRIKLIVSDGLGATELLAEGPFELILCNPPYVNSQSMAQLPAEYRAEPELALAGGADGMDFVRTLLRDVVTHLAPGGILVLEIGHERQYFEAAFPALSPVWLETSAGEDQVLLLSREALLSFGLSASLQ